MDNKEYNLLNEKDLIWGRRYTNDLEKEKILEGHKEGPFVIIKKTDDKIYALNCESKNVEYKLPRYKIDKNNYSLAKDTYVYLKNTIEFSKDRFIKKLSKLTDEDFEQLKKAMYVYVKEGNKINNISLDDLEFKIGIGDVINYKGCLFYIFKEDNEDFYCYQILAINKNKKQSINLNDHLYKFNFSGYKKISKSEDIEFINFANKNMQELIKLYAIKKIDNINTKNILSRGKLIEYNNEYYIIYSEYKNMLLAYKIYLCNNLPLEKKLKQIEIDSGIYFTEFETYEISKSNDIKVLRTASEFEMLKIIKITKPHNYSKKKETKRNVNIVPCTLLYNNDTLLRYVVVERNDNKIILIPFDTPNEIIEYDLRYDFPFTISRTLSNIEYENFLIKLKKYNIQYLTKTNKGL